MRRASRSKKVVVWAVLGVIGFVGALAVVAPSPSDGDESANTTTTVQPIAEIQGPTAQPADPAASPTRGKSKSGKPVTFDTLPPGANEKTPLAQLPNYIAIFQEGKFVGYAHRRDLFGPGPTPRRQGGPKTKVSAPAIDVVDTKLKLLGQWIDGKGFVPTDKAGRRG